jgi:hypothetical protein
MSPGGDEPFTPTYAAGVLELLRGWGLVAGRVGLWDQYLAALREVERQLRTRPREWGDPTHNFHGLAMVGYQRYTPVFIVRYAVHQTHPLVFVREVVLTPGSPLAEGIG